MSRLHRSPAASTADVCSPCRSGASACPGGYFVQKLITGSPLKMLDDLNFMCKNDSFSSSSMQTCSFPRAQEDNSSQGETNALGKKAKMQTQGNISAPGTGTAHGAAWWAKRLRDSAGRDWRGARGHRWLQQPWVGCGHSLMCFQFGEQKCHEGNKYT